MKSGIDFAIVTPLEEERSAMLAHLPGVRWLSGANGDPRIYALATVPVFRDDEEGTYEVVVTDLLAMGRVDAAIVVKDVIQRWAPRYVILTGIAGGFAQAGVKPGDVLIADQIVDFEHQKLTNDGAEIRWAVHRVDPGLLAAARQLNLDHCQPQTRRPEPGAPRRHIGPICSGDKVVANGSLEHFAKTWPRLIGVEMEAGGAASAAFQTVPAPGFLMVRGVSDLADVRKDASSTAVWRGYACEIAAAFVGALLKSAPVPLHAPSADVDRMRGEAALRCPKCGRRALRVHSRSGNRFVLGCKFCSATALLSREGLTISSFIVPGIVTLTGGVAIAEFLKEHGTGDVWDSLVDAVDHLPDLM